jgi:glycosyltransferase involved in cell wall biosynthesis
MNKKPSISIIIPAHNAGPYLDRCLGAISKSSFRPHEVIVVDDGSIDDTAEIGLKRAAKVFKLQNQSGPAAARNYGSNKAKGDVLLFVDADVLIKPETVERLLIDFETNQDIAAVFGSYDDSPVAQSLISRYKNLFHHFIHQHSNEDTGNFWAGCGAIRREVFHTIGGFDENRYRLSSIEDIELGYRLKKSGYRILLDKDLQVKHIKQWKLGSLLRADIFYRAVPWSKLIIENGAMIDDLNLTNSAKISAMLVGLSAGMLPFTVFKFELLYLVLMCLGMIIILNYKFYRFLTNRNGLTFALLAFPLHLLYYFYSGITFVLCRIRYKPLKKEFSIK